MSIDTQPLEGFAATGLSPIVLAALEKAGFSIPTPIQAQAIPVGVQGSDIVGVAQTGTGKTLAFALPIIDRLLQNRNEKALIVVPTRELALQVEESIRKVTLLLNPGLRTISLIGGMPIYRQIRELKANPAIYIVTPGRLRDHLEQRTLNLEKVAVLVLDEADRMLDMGFEPQINYICQLLPTARQTMLFSATMEPEVAKLASKYQTNPVRIEATQSGTSAIQIEQQLAYVQQSGKPDLLRNLLEKHTGTVLVFSRTKHGATNLTRKVQDMGHSAAEIHSNRSLGQRRQALDGFKSGKYRVLVATDVAARGIDVRDIAVVINYDLPDAPADYVHRIGRTGRAGKSGLAISFATPDQYRDVRSIERLISKSLALSEHSEPVPTGTSYGSSSYSSRSRGNYSGQRSSGGYGHSSSQHSSGQRSGNQSSRSTTGPSHKPGEWTPPPRRSDNKPRRFFIGHAA